MHILPNGQEGTEDVNGPIKQSVPLNVIKIVSQGKIRAQLASRVNSYTHLRKNLVSHTLAFTENKAQ